MIRLLLTVLLTAAALPALAVDDDVTPPELALVREPRPESDGGPFVVEARIRDASGVFAPAVLWRLPGTTRFVDVALEERGSVWRALVPAPSTAPGIEFFVEAFDLVGNGPSRIGSPEAPLRAFRPGLLADTEPADTTPWVPADLPPLVAEEPAAAPEPATPEPDIVIVTSDPPPAPEPYLAPQPEPEPARQLTPWKTPVGVALLTVGAALAGVGTWMAMDAQTGAREFDAQFERDGQLDASRRERLVTQHAAGQWTGFSGLGLAALGGAMVAIPF